MSEHKAEQSEERLLLAWRRASARADDAQAAYYDAFGKAKWTALRRYQKALQARQAAEREYSLAGGER